MPLIEELPVTNTVRVSHGWAYVPDVTHPIAAMTQPNPRKRNRHDAGTTNANATAKQLKANQQRLESLGRENWKEGVTVPIPARPGGKERKTKMTANVRRILNYQKGFMHYLADEEAAMVAGGGGPPTTVTTHATPATIPAVSGGGKVDGRRKSSLIAAASIETSSGKRRGRKSMQQETDKNSKGKGKGSANTMAPPAKPVTTIKQEDELNTTSTEESAAAAPRPQAPSIQQHQPKPRPPYDPSYDTNPLLRTLNLPKTPSSRVMRLLTTEPALSYAAARAKPLATIFTGNSSNHEIDDDNDDANTNTASNNKHNNPKSAGPLSTTMTSKLKAKPARHFCATCGYWGRVKCRKCGEWTCGLMECWTDHEGVCVALGMY